MNKRLLDNGVRHANKYAQPFFFFYRLCFYFCVADSFLWLVILADISYFILAKPGITTTINEITK